MTSQKLIRYAKISLFAVYFWWDVFSYQYLIGRALNDRKFFFVPDPTSSVPQTVDFVQFYCAGIAAQKNPPNLYDPALHFAALNEAAKPYTYPVQSFLLQYPPWVFALCQPLALLSIHMAWLVCTIVNLICVAIAARLLQIEHRMTTAGMLALASAMYCAAWIVVRRGQTSLALMIGFIVFFFLLRRKRYLACGLSLPLLMWKMQYMPLFSLVGLIVGRTRFLVGVACSSLLLCLFTIVRFGFKTLLVYPSAVPNGERYPLAADTAHEMENLRGWLDYAFHYNQHLLAAIVTALWFVGLVAVCTIWWRQRTLILEQRNRFHLVSALTVLIALITSVHTHVHDWIAACDAFVFAALFAQRKGSAIWEKAISVLFYLMPLWVWVGYQFSFAFIWSCLIKPVTIFGIINVGYLLFLLARNRELDSGPIDGAGPETI